MPRKEHLTILIWVHVKEGFEMWEFENGCVVEISFRIHVRGKESWGEAWKAWQRADYCSEQFSIGLSEELASAFRNIPPRLCKGGLFIHIHLAPTTWGLSPMAVLLLTVHCVGHRQSLLCCSKLSGKERVRDERSPNLWNLQMVVPLAYSSPASQLVPVLCFCSVAGADLTS